MADESVLGALLGKLSPAQKLVLFTRLQSENKEHGHLGQLSAFDLGGGTVGVQHKLPDGTIKLSYVKIDGDQVHIASSVGNADHMFTAAHPEFGPFGAVSADPHGIPGVGHQPWHPLPGGPGDAPDLLKAGPWGIKAGAVSEETSVIYRDGSVDFTTHATDLGHATVEGKAGANTHLVGGEIGAEANVFDVSVKKGHLFAPTLDESGRWSQLGVDGEVHAGVGLGGKLKGELEDGKFRSGVAGHLGVGAGGEVSAGSSELDDRHLSPLDRLDLEIDAKKDRLHWMEQQSMRAPQGRRELDPREFWEHPIDRMKKEIEELEEKRSGIHDAGALPLHDVHDHVSGDHSSLDIPANSDDRSIGMDDVQSGAGGIGGDSAHAAAQSAEQHAREAARSEEQAQQHVQQAAQHEQEAQEHAQQAAQHEQEAQQHAQMALQHEQEAAQHAQGAAQHEQESAQHAQTAGQHEQESAQHAQTAGQHEQESAQHAQAAGQHEQESAQHAQTAGQHEQESAQHAQTAGQHANEAGQHAQTAGQHDTEAGQHAQAAGQHEAEAGQHAGTAAQHEHDAASALAETHQQETSSSEAQQHTSALHDEAARLKDEIDHLRAAAEELEKAVDDLHTRAQKVTEDAGVASQQTSTHRDEAVAALHDAEQAANEAAAAAARAKQFAG